MHRRTILAALAPAALAVPAAAGAHVTIQPNTASAGAFTVENVRVPNERDDASTVKVEVQLPHGFAEVSYETRPGWSMKVARSAGEVRRITFTGHGPNGRIAPGQFMDFPLSVKVPGKAGDKLTFKAIQTYSSGEVVRWIGAPDADTPAPIVTVTGNEATAATPAATSDGGGGASKGLGITALVLGALGLLAGMAALAVRRSGFSTVKGRPLADDGQREGGS